MTTNSLFFKRLFFEWNNNYRNCKMVIDWTVALYIVVPYGIFALQHYISWWYSAPNWLSVVPFNLFSSIIAIFAWSGTIRIFIKEADQLFLWSRYKWVTEIIMRGIAYSIVINFILNSLFFFLLAPFFLVYYQVSVEKFTILFFLTLLSKVMQGLLKQQIESSFRGFKQVLVLRGTFIFSNIFFILAMPYLVSASVTNQLLIILLLILVISLLVVKRVNNRGSFFKDIERERNEETKHVRLLLAMARIPVPSQKKQRIRPMLFRQSNLIFKERSVRNRLAELCIKSTLRNKKLLLYYAQLVTISIFIIAVFPTTISLLIWLGLSVVLTGFVSIFWRIPMDSNFFRLFKWKDEDIQFGSQKFLFIMTLPGFLIISVFVGFKIFAWIGFLVSIPAGFLVVYIMSNIVSNIIYLSSSGPKAN